MARRKKCNGPCGKLYQSEELTRVAPRVFMCSECVAQTALDENPASVDTVNGSSVPAAETGGQGEAGVEPPASPATIDDLLASGELKKASEILPAPTVVTEIEVDFGNPEERIGRRADLDQATVEGWPLRKGRISASAINTFMRCPEKFRRQYVDGIYEPGSFATAAGGAAHTALEAWFAYQIQSGGSKLDRDGWQPWLDAKLDYEEREGVEWGDAGIDHARYVAGAAVQTYLENIAPPIIPVAVERVFSTRVAGVPVPLVGFVDLVTTRDVRDWKFGRKVSHMVMSEWRAQGYIYLLADELPVMFDSVGYPKKDGECSWSSGESMVVPRTSANVRISRALVRGAVESILAYTDRFGASGPWPGNIGHTWACDSCFHRENGCPWWPQPDAEPLDPFAA